MFNVTFVSDRLINNWFGSFFHQPQETHVNLCLALNMSSLEGWPSLDAAEQRELKLVIFENE